MQGNSIRWLTLPLAVLALAGCGTASSSSSPGSADGGPRVPIGATSPPTSAAQPDDGTYANGLLQPCVLEGDCKADPPPAPCPSGFARDAADPWGACKDTRHQPCPPGYTGWQNTQWNNCLQKPDPLEKP